MDLSKTLDGKITGGHMLARAMAAKGVKRVFALCGGFINPLFMGCEAYGIEVIGCRNELEAGFMATAHARITREPAVCIAEPSGFTNYISAVAEAYYAGDPVIFISASSNSHNFDNAGFKEMPQHEVVRSMTRYAIEVNEGQRIGWFFDKAWDIAINAPTGPVQLAVPTNFLFSGQFAAEPVDTARRFDAARSKVHKTLCAQEDIDLVARLLSEAEKPVVIAGPGVWYSRSENELQDYLLEHNIPAFFPLTHVKSLTLGHPMNMGLVDVHQNPASLAIGQQADLVLLLGGRLDFPLNFGEAPLFRKDQTVVAVNATPRELSDNMLVEHRVCSDTSELFKALSRHALKPKGDPAWPEAIRAARAEGFATYDDDLKSETAPVHPLRVCMEAIDSLTENDIIVIDGGDIASWFEVALGKSSLAGKKLRGVIAPGPWEQMGTGPAFATAIKIACPEARVLLVTGDGSLGLAPGLTPLETSLDVGADVTVMVANNGQWGMIQEQQKAMWGRVVATDLRDIDYADIFAGNGAYTETVINPGDIGAAIHRAVINNEGRSALIDVKTLSARSPITQGLVDMRVRTAIE
ncbi:acetolactate synthase-1/2/3 large subunit [Cribrihabitans marinus]|uniref:Acetolactate synthase-1/2/3 large subunit n=1 Tax=Cribrihabitans marinus TaxID=1227549 RepID=A0A1H7DS58_9RHOB|nr:thiamine pyrophosphate-binding protein [Cribrihabitans marinus]GGH39975.1 acetolactate synthase large subunit [Cribrihabitans marinus]SEK04586.1 acetolactate synthase-1/2/3 large subunit [Cribrihabitans marinus]